MFAFRGIDWTQYHDWKERSDEALEEKKRNMRYDKVKTSRDVLPIPNRFTPYFPGGEHLEINSDNPEQVPAEFKDGFEFIRSLFDLNQLPIDTTLYLVNNPRYHDYMPSKRPAIPHDFFGSRFPDVKHLPYQEVINKYGLLPDESEESKLHKSLSRHYKSGESGLTTWYGFSQSFL